MRPGPSTVQTPPDPITRPKLALYLWERNLRFRDVEAPLGRSYEYIRLTCLPFNDPKRREPDEEFVGRVQAWTQGAVTAADFQPPVNQ